jgi:O-antigen/teichoic acid export membrane protein
VSTPRHNIAALAAVQIIRFTAAFAVSIALARGLGLANYGVYATIATAAHLIAFTSNLGIHQLLPRAIARSPSTEHAGWIRTAWWSTLGGSTVATAALGCWAAVYNPSWWIPAVVAGVSLGLMSLVNVYMAAFEGIRRMALQLRGVVAGRVVVVVATAIALGVGGGLTGVFAAQGLAWLVTLAVFGWTWRRTVHPSDQHIDAASMVRASVPFAGFVAFAALQERVDILILDAVRGPEDVGIYRGATLFLINIPIVARIVSTAAYPSLATKRDPTELGHILRLLLAVGAAFAVGGWLVGPSLVHAALGDVYVASGPLLALGALGLPIVFLRIGCSLGLLTLDAERTRFAGMAVAAAVNVVLNLLIIPIYGATGAMATTIACEALLLALYMWPVRRTMIGVAKTSWRALLPSGVLAAVLVTPVPLALSTGLGIAAWSAAAWSVGGVTRADLKRLRRL